MDTPTEPEGGRGSHSDIKITLLASSGKPWQGGFFEHNGKKYPVGADGSTRLPLNGGEVYANRFAVTGLVRKQVQLGVSDIILQHDSWKGVIKLQQK